MTRTYVKIIVEQAESNWSAWFEAHAQNPISCTSPQMAIALLLRYFGDKNFDIPGLYEVEGAFREGHLEFMIPLMGRKRIPPPSANGH